MGRISKKSAIIAIFTIVAVIILISFFYIYKKNIEVYKKADQMEEQAVEMAKTYVYEEGAEPTIDEDDAEETVENISYNPDLFESYDDYLEYLKGISEHETDPYMTNRINFNLLDSSIPDNNSWLIVPDTNINYIVMQGTKSDPYKYLWKDPYGKSSKTGSLFVRYMDDDEEDDHTIIYGHRLRNHSLYFGQLLDFKDKKYAEEHTALYLYKKDKVVKYVLRSVNSGLDTDGVYCYPFKRFTSDYEVLINSLADTKLFNIGNEEFNKNRKMLVLSTCSGRAANQPDRLYLIYEEDSYWDYK